MMLRRVDLPQLLEADAVGLRVAAGAQVEALEQGLGQRPVAALGEHRLPPVEFDAGFEIGGRLAVAADAHRAGGDTADAAVLGVEDFGGGETGIDLDLQCLRLLAEPAAQIAEADDVVAVVVHLRRGEEPDRPLFGQEQELVLGRRRQQRRPAVLPVGEQLGERPRLEHRAGKNMGADLRALLDDADIDFAAGVGGHLLEPDRRRQAGRAGADDDDIIFHRFPFHRLTLRHRAARGPHNRLPKT